MKWYKLLVMGTAVCVACYFGGIDNVSAKNDKGNQGNGYGNTGPGNRGNDKDVGNAGGNRNTPDTPDTPDGPDTPSGPDGPKGKKEGKSGGSTPYWTTNPPTGICYCDYPINYFFDENCVPLEDGEDKICS